MSPAGMAGNESISYPTQSLAPLPVRNCFFCKPRVPLIATPHTFTHIFLASLAKRLYP